MEIEQILERLCAAGGPSGFEGPAVLAARELLEAIRDLKFSRPTQENSVPGG